MQLVHLRPLLRRRGSQQRPQRRDRGDVITILRLLKRVLAFSITIKPQIHNMEIFLFSVVILGPAVWSIALTSHRITRTIRCNHSLVFIHSSSICLLMNCQVARIPQVENMVQWSFLEPWRAVLRGNAIQRSNDTARSVLRVAIFFEENNAIDQTIYLKVPPDATKQQQLREAMELFTVLSFMDNKAFIELATRSTATQTTKIRADCFWFPKWELQLYDSTSYAGGDQTRATWGTLLGFSDEYSREFQKPSRS